MGTLEQRPAGIRRAAPDCEKNPVYQCSQIQNVGNRWEQWEQFVTAAFHDISLNKTLSRERHKLKVIDTKANPKRRTGTATAGNSQGKNIRPPETAPDDLLAALVDQDRAALDALMQSIRDDDDRTRAALADIAIDDRILMQSIMDQDARTRAVLDAMLARERAEIDQLLANIADNAPDIAALVAAEQAAIAGLLDESDPACDLAKI